MKNILLKSIFALFTLSATISCVNDDAYDIPVDSLQTYELTPTKTVAEIKTAATLTPVVYTADDVIEAYVTSSDEKGMFYKSISFQTIPTDASAPIGFSVPINAGTLYGKGFTPGRKVFIKLNGLYTAIVFGSLQIGDLFEGTIGRIAENKWQNHLFISGTKVNEDSFVRTLALGTAFTDDNQNTLVELNPVQFAESSLNRTYYDVDSGGGATNHSLISTTGGAAQVIRFSNFSPFTGNKVPSGSGKIRGVLTKFSTTFQFTVRYETDVKLTAPRVDVNPPVVGNALQFLSAFTENFESYLSGTATTGQFNFPLYINDPDVGTKLWRCRTSGTKYIEMSSFGTPSEKNRALFIVPVAMTGTNKLSFRTRVSFFTGNQVKVYYSTNYTPGSNINSATLVNITSNFFLSDGSNSNFNSSIPAGGAAYTLPNVGNAYIIFEYVGSGLSTPAMTTNFGIDDIVVN